MNDLARFIAKLLAFLFLVVIGQAYLARQSFPVTIATLDAHLQRGTKVILFGDSTMEASADPKDTRLTIADQLGSINPSLDFVAIAHGAYSADLFRYFLSYIVRQPRRPSIVIVPINLRSFGLQWRTFPQWRFVEEQELLRYPGSWIAYRPLAAFKAIQHVPISMDEYEELMRRRETETALWPWIEGMPTRDSVATLSGGAADFSPEEYRRAFLIRFAATEKEEEETLKNFADICRTARSAGMRVVCYIHPVNHELGGHLFGPSFVQYIQCRARRIQDIVEANGGDFIDLSLALDAEAFTSAASPLDEHLKFRGRGFIAEVLNRKLLEIPRSLRHADASEI